MIGHPRLLSLLTISIMAFSTPILVQGGEASAYWQQEVNYRMEIELSSDNRTIDGKIEIEYINNSPDDLSQIFLKAFPNAIQAGSYADKKKRRGNDFSYAVLKPEQEGRLSLHGLETSEQFSPHQSAHTSITF
ncbi:MAG: hypothetical protein V3T31_13365, partial [candidate division Zixibacteria bacterium]